jgi:hypothetical protein
MEIRRKVTFWREHGRACDCIDTKGFLKSEIVPSQP